MYSDINERSGVSVAIHGHTLYVFGGRTDNETAMNDLSTFDLLTVEWKRLTTNGPRPLPRSNAIMGFIEDQLFLYGGYKCPLQDFGDARLPPTSHILRTLVLNDLYSFRRGTNTWKQILKDTEGPRLRGHYNGVFLPPVVSDPETHPGLLVLLEASDTQYLTFALLPETGFWFALPHCPQSPPQTPNSTLLSRSPLCALSEKDVLVLTHHPATTFAWILSRRARTSDSVSYSVGWTWTEVQLRSCVNKMNFPEPLEILGGAELVCLPKLPHQEWPTVAMLRRIRLSTIRAHLNRRLREGPRRLPDVGSISSSSSSPPSVNTQPEAQPNPLVQVFDELHDPTQPAGAPGQPLRGAIIRRVASSSSTSLTSLLRHPSTAASRKRRSSQVSGTRFVASMVNTSSDEPESNSDSLDPDILALCTLTLFGRPSRSRPRLMLCKLDGPSDQDYYLDSLPLSRSFAAFTYGLGSLLVFGAPRTRLVNVEYMNGVRDKRPLVWAISGSRVVCGFEAPSEA
nr:Kelch motif family protein [Echinococcus granulosus]